MGVSKFLKSYFSPDPTPRGYILFPVGGGPTRGERIVVAVVVILFLFAAIFFAWAVLTDWTPAPRPAQSTEYLRGGNPNSQVIGDHLGGPDRPAVRVGRRPDVGEPRP